MISNAIIGAGPAGLAAAREFVSANLPVLIIDSYLAPGGQYWRHRQGEKFPETGFTNLFQSPLATWRYETSIWQIEKLPDRFILHGISKGKSEAFEVKNLLIATGALERTLPIPGWTLPGVMTAGAMQSLAKNFALSPGTEIVIAGSGPFLFPVAKSLLSLRNPPKIVGLYEMRSNLRWWRNLLGLALNPAKIQEAFAFLVSLRKSKVKVHNRKRVVRVRKSELGLTVTIRDSRNHESEVNCDSIALSHGFIPDLTIASILKLQTRDRLGETTVKVDQNQGTSVPGVWAAGEITGIGGHELAMTEGVIAARSMINSSSGKTSTAFLIKLRKWRQQIFADGINRIYRLDDSWIDWSKEDVTVCRCEEVTREEILSSFLELGADSARTSKLFTRAGMGMCQGRICQRSVQDIAARFSSEKSATVRPIGGAVTLGELSD